MTDQTSQMFLSCMFCGVALHQEEMEQWLASMCSRKTCWRLPRGGGAGDGLLSQVTQEE
jgi:hypothetical protein